MDFFLNILFALFGFVIGIYILNNPKIIQQDDIKSIEKKYKFLLKSKYTSKYYYNMLEDAKSNERLLRIKFVAYFFIFASCLIILSLIKNM